jgi:hypothetical protein
VESICNAGTVIAFFAGLYLSRACSVEFMVKGALLEDSVLGER